MKKVLSIIAVAALSTAFVSCGPSKEEMEKREKERSDSTAAVEKSKQDSIAAVEAESARMAEEAANMEKMKADSIHKADSMMNMKGGKMKKH